MGSRIDRPGAFVNVLSVRVTSRDHLRAIVVAITSQTDGAALPQVWQRGSLLGVSYAEVTFPRLRCSALPCFTNIFAQVEGRWMFALHGSC